MLIVGGETIININSGVINVYTVSHADFEGFEFYAARQYVNFKREVREEGFFIS